MGVIKDHIVWHFWDFASLLLWGLQATRRHKVLFCLWNLIQRRLLLTRQKQKLFFKVGRREKLNTNPSLNLTLKMPVERLFYSTSFDYISHLNKARILIRSRLINNFLHWAVLACKFICQPWVQFNVLAIYVHRGWFKPDVEPCQLLKISGTQIQLTIFKWFTYGECQIFDYAIIRVG